MDVYLDATTLIALGAIGELDVLARFDGRSVVPEAIAEEGTTEPARTNLERFCEREGVHRRPIGAVLDDRLDEAKRVLDEDEPNGDVQIVADVLAHTALDDPIGVVSDDRRVRTVSRGLGATVTGTVGVIVRAVEEGLAVDDARGLIERVDSHGLHMTAELRETAYHLVERAAGKE